MLQNKNIKRRTCSHIADVLAEVRFIFCSVFSRSSIWSLGFFVSFSGMIFFFFFRARKWDEILCDCFLSVEMNKLWKCILVTSIKRWHFFFYYLPTFKSFQVWNEKVLSQYLLSVNVSKSCFSIWESKKCTLICYLKCFKDIHF